MSICGCSGFFTSTRGASPSRPNDRIVPSSSSKVTWKASIRTSLPSTFAPVFGVNVTSVGLVLRGVPKPPRRTTPATHVFCSTFGSANRVAIPRKSPVTAWQPAHFCPKNFSPSPALPTRIDGGAISLGGFPCPPIVSITLRT